MGLSASAQKASVTITPKQIAAAERELKDFFDSYAEDLRKHRREAIADRYDGRGTFFMGRGRKTFDSIETIKDRYLNKWDGPKSFLWKDLSFEILAPSIAAVLGRFEWQTEGGKTFNFSYTGVLVKSDGRWRIRIEDESPAP